MVISLCFSKNIGTDGGTDEKAHKTGLKSSKGPYFHEKNNRHCYPFVLSYTRCCDDST